MILMLIALSEMGSNPVSVLSSPYDSALKPTPLGHKLPLNDKNLQNVPTQFIWPQEATTSALGQLNEPLVDLGGFLRGDRDSTLAAAKAIGEACSRHGFFQVVNHGIDQKLIRAAYDEIGVFFKSPVETKLRARRKAGSMWGYSSAHGERFTSKLPWKETLSFGFSGNSEAVVEFFESELGEGFAQTGMVYRRYCEAMKELSLEIMELLAISLGVERLHYREFFEDSCVIMRCNSYPPCKDPTLVLGTGPHTDPTSLTILHQDQVGGLEVFADGKWQKVQPRNDALVINIGDTFMAMSNGRYKSCVHRAVINECMERRSLVFFLCSGPDKVVRPPQGLLQGGGEDHVREYPDFTWSDLIHFIGKHHRPDQGDTLRHFTEWILSQLSPRVTEIDKDS